MQYYCTCIPAALRSAWNHTSLLLLCTVFLLCAGANAGIAAETGTPYTMENARADIDAANHLLALEPDAATPENRAQAYQLFAKAAENASVPEAQFMLGVLYVEDQQYVLGKEWLEKAVAQNYADAQACLGSLYYHGTGVEQDYVKAKDLLEKAAEQNNDEAQFMLGNMYYSGNGVPQNYATAMRWYQKAAVQDNYAAQDILDSMRDEGYIK